jgi:hypothetical protein
MRYRDDPAVRVRSDLILPVCDVCGDSALDEPMTDALDAALEAAYVRKRRKVQCALINDLRRRGFTQRQIERFASVSPGYLSKLKQGKVASGGTFRLLYLLHEMPDEVMAVVSRLDPGIGSRKPEKQTTY